MPRSRQQWQYGYQCGLRLNAIHDKMYDKRWLNICHLFGWFSPDKIIQLNFISMFIHWKRSSRSYTLSVRVLHSWFFTWRFADEMAAMASKSFNYQCNFITHTGNIKGAASGTIQCLLMWCIEKTNENGNVRREQYHTTATIHQWQDMTNKFRWHLQFSAHHIILIM